MAQAKEAEREALNSFTWGMAPVFGNPALAIMAEVSGTILESVAAAQKEWVDFMHRRIKEDVAVSRQLMGCHSLADMHQVYSQYLRTTFEQYQNQSERVVQRGQSMAQHLAETAETGTKEGARARH